VARHSVEHLCPDGSQTSVQKEPISRTRIDASSFISVEGLKLPRNITFEAWISIGRHLSRIYSSSAWCLGDWLAYGEDAFTGRYREAIEATSLNYQTLRNYAWVARRFPLPRRRDDLSFAHHTEVAALAEPEQDFWLRKAAELAWSVKRLRQEVRTSLQERAVEGGDPNSSSGQNPEDDDKVTLKVQIPMEHLEACRAAACRLGLNVDDWASQVLMQAASRVGIAA